MTKLWFCVVAILLAIVVRAFFFSVPKAGPEPEATVTTDEKAQSGGADYKPSSLIDGEQIHQARQLLGYGTKEMNAWAVRTLRSIPKSDKNYATAQRLLATIPRDKKAEAKIEADLRTSRAAERRRQVSGEWSQERIDLELRLHPERRERMARDTRALHDAIKEKYGPDAALKFLQKK